MYVKIISIKIRNKFPVEIHSNEEPNALPIDPKEPDSHIDEGGHALNTYYIVDNGTCKVCVFNLYFETKGMEIKEQEIGLLPDSVLPTDGKSMGFPASVYRNAGGYINWWDIIPESSDDVFKYCSSGMYYL
ncbi:MAG: hypothetical protein EZS28_036691 [Streblomastix strix]|uniref:Uncharacterized protein n=1 Tax=Streblomastix strix TaxID=222440 RepID=A0A5J4UD42_9EUKA|nr:MAG: hypothetical protein EZS28_036691 [Streblomastix strix]